MDRDVPGIEAGEDTHSCGEALTVLLLFLVTAPDDAASIPPLRDALASTSFDHVLASSAHLDVARSLAAPRAMTASIDARLDDPATAAAAIEHVARRIDGTLLAVVDVPSAGAIVRYALASHVPDERIAFDPGAYAEIEVRLDAPCTVNRLNNRCHVGALLSGIVQT